MQAKILIIDDENIQASFYEWAFRRKAYDVKRVMEVDRALDIVAEWSPDVIVLDIMMPPGKRYAAKQHFSGLRTGVFLIPDLLDCLPSVIIVVSTAVKNAETLEMVRAKLPAEQVTLKAEYDPQRLADLVEHLLATRRQRSSDNG
jgi:CheY-like chemotaxis protein